MANLDIVSLSDDQIVSLVSAFDRQGLPLSRRFEGDDEVLREFFRDHGINGHASNFSVVLCAVLREATIRGLTIPSVN